MNGDKMTHPSSVLSAEKRELLSHLMGEENAAASPRILKRGSTTAPLSFAQHRMWFLHQMASETAAVYNNSLGARIKGSLNIEALERALNEVIARHEVLRTTFQLIDDAPTQVISPPSPVKINVVDLSQSPEPERRIEERRLCQLHEATPFDLASGPLLRASLLRLQPDEYVFLFCIHHIISDGWTTGLLQNELFALYEAYCADKASPLPELPIQYADYCWWQREYLQGAALRQQIEYWCKNMAGAPAALDLPTDFPRPPLQGVRGGYSMKIWPADLCRELKAFSRREGVTLFMVLLSAFEVLLARYSGQHDLVIGTPIAGRTRLETEPLIGLFLNALPLRADLSGDPTVQQVLRRTRETALQAYANQEVPFEKLVEELQPQRDLSRSPLFQVMFILQNAPLRLQTASGIHLSPLEISTQFSKYDLTLITVEFQETLRVGIEFNSDLFESSTIERMGKHLENLLRGMIADPDARVFELPLMGEDERRAVVETWNNTGRNWNETQCVIQSFESQVSQTPERTAASFDGSKLTYSELNARANQLAHFLRDAGAAQNALVAVSLERSLEMLVAILAVLKAGSAYLPIDPEYPAERIAFMLQDSSATILLTEQKFLNRFPPHNNIICIDRETVLISQQSRLNPSCTPIQDLAYVIYTSGSTGKPKGVMIPRRALGNFLLSMRERPGITADDVLLAVTTLSFDIAGLELYLPLIVGGQVEIASREISTDPVLLVERMVQSKATVMQATPATWRMLLDSGWKGNSQLKVLCGGEAFPRELANQLLQRCGSVWNMYGPTETTIWSAVSPVQADEGAVPIGKPIANTQLYVLDERLQPVPVGVVGELYIGGAGLAVGYLRRPELTAERFINGPFANQGSRIYKTGDQARYRSDGVIECLGRLDSQVKLRGYRIELEEVEAVLAEYPGIQRAIVAVREDVPGEKYLVAYLIPAERSTPIPAELRAHVSKFLPQYMVPSAFVALDTIPLTPNGKVDRRALPMPDRSRCEAEASYVGPRTNIEEKLTAIWAEILNVNTVGVNDNFFELGGHSLLLTRLRHELEYRMNVRISIIDLFRYPTVGALAEFVGKNQPETHIIPQVRNRAELRRRLIQRHTDSGNTALVDS